MALPSTYLMTTGKLGDIFAAIRSAQAPPRFTQKFLEGLGFTSTNDRLIINMLKALGFLSDTGEPLPRYHEYLDATQSKRVLAEGVRHAYSDLFQINVNANTMSRTDVKNKMKTLSQGQYSDSVLDKMASTFKALAALGDFSVAATETEEQASGGTTQDEQRSGDDSGQGPRIKGLVYNINLHLPESRDPAVYDALFRSLRQHVL